MRAPAVEPQGWICVHQPRLLAPRSRVRMRAKPAFHPLVRNGFWFDGSFSAPCGVAFCASLFTPRQAQFDADQSSCSGATRKANTSPSREKRQDQGGPRFPGGRLDRLSETIERVVYSAGCSLACGCGGASPSISAAHRLWCSLAQFTSTCPEPTAPIAPSMPTGVPI